ncbi:protein ALP1-like [Neltuma alba]|uniref:protein ALP1-like n=1 Tax=Neltuma alba TaxID=207710 RepID=UPI0010A4AE08|nr:protein ALP1-like [Prosopis alba]
MDIDGNLSNNEMHNFEGSTSSSESSEEDFELSKFMIINMICEYESKFLNKIPVRTSALTGREFVNELMQGSGTTCYELLRMERACFISLCNELRTKGYLEDSRGVMLEEKVAMFLYIIGHNLRQRVVSDRFQHSTETISRHFKEVLRSVCQLGKELIKQETTELPAHVRNNPMYYPWFKNCVGAIDGTHISAWVSSEKQASCRGRKTVVTQNVMCICDFNMMFTYVYSGWEGSAHDAKVLLDAITNPEANFPWPPRGSFYLVDSGYSCTGGFLPPYRGERYHAQEYQGRGRQARNAKELFNYRHSSLRMTIERCFGVLKARFPILKLMPSYKPSRQRLIVVACCAIHNYIRKWSRRDLLFTEWENMNPAQVEELTVNTNLEIQSLLGNANVESTNYNLDNLSRLSDQSAAEMSSYRDQISTRMWLTHHNSMN